jgi:hypothetical protein
MKNLPILLVSLLSTNILFGQEHERFVDGKEFNSVFQSLESGEFQGTTNGLLIIEKNNGSQLLLDFQRSEAVLQIEKDSNEVYDVSTKSYSGKTTSGQTEISYETYARANGIGVKLKGQWFEITAIDGACDMVINGLKYLYKAESNTEYLIINVEKEIELSNWQYIIRTEHTMEPNNIEDLRPKKSTMKILPYSTLVFAIKRK